VDLHDLAVHAVGVAPTVTDERGDFSGATGWEIMGAEQ
jgi:hypothetical protein